MITLLLGWIYRKMGRCGFHTTRFQDAGLPKLMS
jgi:hypothetical protein